jgi:ATPase subunit of ABC transporter with duplicated ATPase domains
MNKIVSALVVGYLAIGLVACGGSGSSTSGEGTASETAAASAEVERLKLEKEKAEAEAQKAQTEAHQEARLAAKQKQKAAAATASAKKAAAKSESEAELEPEPEPAEVPNVVGMRLPEAKSTLSAAGYSTQAENTDTAFGIVVPSHYTICEQGEPHGNVVTVLAQKYGC